MKKVNRVVKVRCPICGKEFEVKEGYTTMCPNCGAPLRITVLEGGITLAEVAPEERLEEWEEKDIVEFEEEELEELWGDIEES